MIEGLRALQARYAFDLHVVDIDDDPALEERYGCDVPVLAHGARELCRHALAREAVTDYLGQFS
jgi:thioredoxin reductase (NADPH)